MSRIGKKPVMIPGGVTVAVKGNAVSVKGPKGELALEAHPEMTVSVDEGARQVAVARPTDHRRHRALHGLTRALVANMVEGVTEGYEKQLEIVGVGYRAEAKGKDKLVMQIGFCHPVELVAPKGIAIETPEPTKIMIRGCDKQQVGQFAAVVRGVRPPEPYKGKGIRYVGEYVRRKAGKSFAGGGA